MDFSNTNHLHDGRIHVAPKIRKNIILQSRLLLIRKGVSSCLYTVIMVTNDQHIHAAT